LINGNIRTLDPEKPRAEALAVAGGKIVSVGSDQQIRKLAGERTRVIDAKGRLVLPGFNDAHVHFAAIGNKFSTIDLKAARTAEEIAARIAEYARFLPKGRWILGGGLDLDIARGGGLRGLVQAVTPGNPVFVYGADSASAFANGPALQLAGIDSGFPGGSGSANGTLPEGVREGILTGDELKRVALHVPKDHSKNWPEVLETASNYAASFGVTSVQDMHSDELADVYRELERAGRLKTRIYDCSPPSAVQRTAAAVRTVSVGSMVRTGCIKTFTDGDEADAERLKREITAADKAGLQVMVHAMGPRANAITLDAFEQAAKANGRRDRRFRIEHAHNAAESDLPRFAASGIVASMQPWLFYGGSRPSPFDRHLKLGTRLAFGSDASMADLDPLLGIRAAISGPGSIGLEEALRAYTTGSAFAEFQEKVKGKIKPGYLADLVVLSDNIFARNFSRWSEVAPVLTIVNGKVVYELGPTEVGTS
jgi:predicted amidohydrolase YtcJ